MPKQFLLRILGGKFVSQEDKKDFEFLSEAGQALVYYEMSRIGQGPKLYGVFEGGRLEEYIPSTTLSDDHLKDPKLRAEFARKLARYHTLQLPFPKKPADFLGQLETHHLKKFNRDDFLANDIVKQTSVDIDLVSNYDVIREVNWLREELKTLNGRVQFCLKDMNRLNALVRDVPDDNNERIVLIDYEISSYMIRGNDLGCHYNMWSTDLAAADFVSTLSYPSSEIQLEYARSYLEEAKKLDTYKWNDEVDCPEQLVKESMYFSLVNMLLFFSMFVASYQNLGDELSTNELLIKVIVSFYLLINI